MKYNNYTHTLLEIFVFGVYVLTDNDWIIYPLWLVIAFQSYVYLRAFSLYSIINSMLTCDDSASREASEIVVSKLKCDNTPLYWLGDLTIIYMLFLYEEMALICGWVLVAIPGFLAVSMQGHLINKCNQLKGK